MGAVHLLENAKAALPILKEPAYPMLRLWRYPAFSPLMTWTVFAKSSDVSMSNLNVRNRSSVGTVREIRWDRPYDYNRLLVNPMEGLKTRFSADPSINVRDAKLFPEHLIWLKQKCQLINVNVDEKRKVVLDGIACGLQMIDPFGDAKMVWHEIDGRTRARLIINVGMEMRTFLLDCFD